MSLINEIQSDILDEETSLAITLRKAKVFARQIKVESLESWANFELDGYPSYDLLPSYRKKAGACYGSWSNTAWHRPAQQVPAILIPEQIRNGILEMPFAEGVRSIEDLLSRTKDRVVRMHPHEFVMIVNKELSNGWFESTWTQLERHEVAMILDSIRNRLLTFVLDLKDSYPDLSRGNETVVSTSAEEISREVSRTVWGIDRTLLIVFIDQHFTQNEIDSLCVQMHIDPEEIPGPEKSTRATKLVTYCERRSWLQKLYNETQKQRPDVPLPPLAK